MRALTRRQLLAATGCTLTAQSLGQLQAPAPSLRHAAGDTATDSQSPLIELADAHGGDSGANRVGYMQAGNGAQARTVGDKLRERYSLFDFMSQAQREDISQGRSLLDHTAALNLALASGYEIELPSGVLNARYLELQDGSRLIGQGHIAGQVLGPGVAP